MTDKVQKIRAFLVGIADADGVSTILAKAIEKKILPYIDSLQEEPVSDDLEEAADNCYLRDHAFAREAFIEGAIWKERQMMKDAVKGEARYTMSVPSITISLPNDIKVGDKVKLIIIKED